MSLYITIDGGTTNTRIALVRDRVIVDSIKLHVGARRGIENKELLVSEIKDAIEKCDFAILGGGSLIQDVTSSYSLWY